MAFASAHKSKQRIQLGRYQADIAVCPSRKVEQHSHANSIGLTESSGREAYFSERSISRISRCIASRRREVVHRVLSAISARSAVKSFESLRSQSYFPVAASSLRSISPISGLPIKFFHTRPVR